MLSRFKEKGIQMTKKVIFLTIIAFLTITSLLQAQIEWNQHGPGGGGALICAAVDPLNPDVCIIGTDMNGFVRTEDGGATWVSVIEGMYDNSQPGQWTLSQMVKFLPNQSDSVWAVNLAGAYLSVDGGITWERKAQDPMGYGVDQHTAFSWKPSNHSLLLFGRGDRFLDTRESDFIYKTIDNGNSVSRVYLPDEVSCNSFVWNTLESETVYLATNKGLFISINDGDIWTELNTNLTNIHFNEMIGFVQNNTFSLVATIKPSASDIDDGDLVRSDDGGINWYSIKGNIPAFYNNRATNLFSLSFNSTCPDTIYVSSCNFGGYNTNNDVSGVYRTYGGGDNWQHITRVYNNGFGQANFSVEWVYFWNIGGWTLATSTNGTIYYGCSYINKSIDFGEAWENVWTNEVAPDVYCVRGYEELTCGCFGFSPNNPNEIFCGVGDVGLLKTDSSMAGFEHIEDMVAIQPIADVTLNILFHPSNPNIIFRGMLGGSYLVNVDGGVVMSSDGGETWQFIVNGLPQEEGCCIAADWTSNKLYSLVFNNGLYVSVDFGQNWNLLYSFPDGYDDPCGFDVDENNPQRIVCGFRSFAGIPGVFLSNDGGNSFTDITPPNANHVSQVKFSPHNNNVYASTCIDGGLWVYDGQIWEQILEEPFVETFCIHPEYENVIYAGSGMWGSVIPNATYGFLRTDNNGETWTREVDGLTVPSLLTIDVSPYNPKKIYVGSYGAGFFTGIDNKLVTSVPENALLFTNSVINIYPNPTTGIFTIEGNNIQSVEITNIRGQLVFQSKRCNNKSTVDISNQSKGIYFIKVVTDKTTTVEELLLE